MGLEELFKEKEDNVKLMTDELGSDVAHVIPFNIPPLDIILGGGLYSGKVYEVSGWESSGKSTFALEATKAFSRYWKSKGEDDKYVILWVESESSLDKVRAAYMDCDLSSFLTSEADTVEEGFNTIEKYLKKSAENGMHLLIIWDTIAAAPTINDLKDKKSKDEEDATMWSGGIMEKPRIIRFFLKRIINLLGASNSILILVNQRYKVPPKKGAWGGPTEDTPGGGGIKFHASVRLEMKNKGDIERILPSGEKIVAGIRAEVYTTKNKLILPHQKCTVVLYGEEGFNKFETVFNFVKMNKLVEIKASWQVLQFMGKDVKFQNADQLREIVKATPDLEDYMDYLVYKVSSTFSPLIKLKIIKKLWGYEEKFGQKRTALTEKEINIAQMMYSDIQKEEIEE